MVGEYAGRLESRRLLVGSTDQRSQINTFNIAPTWTHLMGTDAVFTFGAFVRHDQYNYYPSNNPFADLGPATCNERPSPDSRSLTMLAFVPSSPT